MTMHMHLSRATACLWAATHPSVPQPEHPTPRCHGHLGQCRGTCHMSLPKHRSMGDGICPAHATECVVHPIIAQSTDAHLKSIEWVAETLCGT
jgi:hypothetical protein